MASSNLTFLAEVLLKGEFLSELWLDRLMGSVLTGDSAIRGTGF